MAKTAKKTPTKKTPPKKAAAKTDAKKPPKKKADPKGKPAKQGVLPGMPKPTKKLIRLADDYEHAKNERCRLTTAEAEAKAKLIEAMKAEKMDNVETSSGLEAYELTVKDPTDSLKIKKTGPKGDDE